MIKAVVYDVDGVLLDWQGAFINYLTKKGYRPKREGYASYSIFDHFHDLPKEQVDDLIGLFNTSHTFGALPHISGATEGVWTLKRRLPDARHVVVTSAGLKPQTVYLRAHQLLGFDFDEVRIIGLRDDKRDLFQHYGSSGRTIVIEDSPRHLETARAVGCEPIAYDQPWNQQWAGERVRTWKELVDVVAPTK